MPIPLLAGLGLLAGGQFAENMYQRRQREQANQQLQDIIGAPGAPIAGPVQPGQGPLMRQGTGLMGGQLSVPQAAARMMTIPGYGQVGANILQSHLMPRKPGAVKTITVGVPGQPDMVTEKMLVNGQLVDIPGMVPRKRSTGVTINTGEKLPVNYRWTDPADPSKGVTPIEGGPAQEPTGQERTAAGFANRMLAANQGLDDLVSETNMDPAAWQMKASEFIPFGLEGIALDPDQQRYRQFAQDWIRAKLRKESGAVIGDKEMVDEYRTYFPIFGDSPETIEQKAQARKEAERSMLIESGKAREMALQGQEKVDPDFIMPGGTWEDEEYEYRKLMDGTVQRRKK